MPDGATDSSPDPKVHYVTGWRIPVLWFLSALVRLWDRTIRVEVSPSDRETANYHDKPCVCLLWHNRLFMVAWAKRHLRNRRRFCALVSASRDGAALVEYLKHVGIRTVRGSSHRFGREAIHEAIRCLRDDYDLAVTPDGPKGPKYELKPGALIAARRTHSPIILFGFEYKNAWLLKSWDHFGIPKPFSRVIIRTERLDPHTLGHGKEAIAFLRKRLLELSGEDPDETENTVTPVAASLQSDP